MIRITSLLFILISSSIIGQNNTASPYSSTGLGERSFNGTQATRHMGGLDVFTDSIHANLVNPASYAFLKFTTYSVGVNYTNNNLSSMSESTNVELAALDYLSVSIPTKKFSFGFGIVPYSSLGYRIQAISENQNQNIFNRYEGSGGLNKAYFSIGIPITKFFALGSTINYNFGNLFYRTGQFIEGVENGTFLTHDSSISGFNYQFSAQAIIPFGKKYSTQLMFSHQPLRSLDSQNSKIYYTQSLSRETIIEFTEIDLASSSLENTNLDISPITSVGIGFGRNKKWFLGAQYDYTKSSNFKNQFFERQNISYKDGQKWVVGGYFIPNYSSFTSFWKRVVYRFGFRTQQMSIIVNNSPIKETGITFGLGLPLAGLSNANVGFELSQRGKRDSGMVQETIASLRIGLSLNDIWFIKRRYN